MNTNRDTTQKSNEQLTGRKHQMTTKEQGAWNRMHGIPSVGRRVKRNTKAMAGIYNEEWM